MFRKIDLSSATSGFGFFVDTFEFYLRYVISLPAIPANAIVINL